MKNTARIIREQSSFKVLFIVVFIAIFEGGLYWLFLDGFRFLDHLGGMGAIVINRLFSLFFLGMGIMLVLSSIVTAYSTIFRSEELEFMLAHPFTMSEILSSKFLESTRLSSWAFFFIIAPFVASYSWHLRMSPMFAFWTIVYSLPFLILCSGIGTIITIALMRWFPRGKRFKLAVGLLAVCVCVATCLVFRDVRDLTDETTFRIARLVPGLKLSSNALMPSWWVAEGILGNMRGDYSRSLLFLLTIASSAAMVYIALDTIGCLTFYECWQRQANRAGDMQRAPRMFPFVSRLLRVLPGDARSIVMKDLRTFFRDPLQWSQALVFFGLLGIYFANLRSFNYQRILPDQWLNTIAFLNVFSVAAVMTSMGSRFVFPQLSLEGQGFWLLGLSPSSIRRIVLTKFAMSLCGMLTVSIPLILLSTRMLGSPHAVEMAALALACAISFAVSGFSIGLGAVFLDLEQRNPAAIVSGFGGTLNLVLCLVFMLSAIAPFAVVFHTNSILRFLPDQLAKLVFFCSLWLVILTVLSTSLPVIAGIKALKRRDF